MVSSWDLRLLQSTALRAAQWGSHRSPSYLCRCCLDKSASLARQMGLGIDEKRASMNWKEWFPGCYQSLYRRLEDGLFSLWQISLLCIVSSVSSQWMNKHAAMHTLESSPKKDRIVDGRSCWFLKTDLFQAIPPPSEPCQIKQGLCCHKCRTRADCKLCLEWKDIFDSYAGKSSWACVVGPQGWAVVFGIQAISIRFQFYGDAMIWMFTISEIDEPSQNPYSSPRLGLHSITRIGNTQLQWRRSSTISWLRILTWP